MNDFAERVSKATVLMDEAHQLLRYGGLEYHLKEMAAAYELLMSRFAPFKVGDRVQLAKTPDINAKDSWGWMGCRHFLVKGSPGKVEGASCGARGFVFDIVFDRETWIDGDGKEQPMDRRHCFCFREEWLEHVAP